MDTARPNTLVDFLISKGAKSFFFDGPMPQEFSGGNYALTASQMATAERLGKEIIDLARKSNVDITQFPEVKAAMGYDKDPTKLTAEELGAFMVGYAMQNSTKRTFELTGAEPKSVLQSALTATFNRKASMLTNAGTPREANEIGIELGREIYGDTKPNLSSTDTTGPNSQARLLKVFGPSN